MTAAHFASILSAEIRKTLSRGSGLATVVAAALAGLLAFLLVFALVHQGAYVEVGQNPLTVSPDGGLAMALAFALQGRNFFLLALPLLWAAAASVAGEMGDRTMREALCHAVPREFLLLAKLLALTALAALALLVTFSVAALASLLAFGPGPGVGKVALGFLASLPSDLGLISLAFLAGVWLRSVPAVLVGVVLFLGADMFLRLLLGAVAFFMPDLAGLADWLPGAALNAWSGYDGGFLLSPWCGLGVLIVLALGVTLARFRKVDLP